MSFASLRTLVLSLNQSAHGVSATVTRVAPSDTTPITTTVLWPSAQPLQEDPAYGLDLGRKAPRRVMAISRADVPTLPMGTTVVAPEQPDGTNMTWRVDGMERVEADTWRAIVMVAP